MIVLHEIDALTWLRSLPDASVDLVLTDPPYPSLDRHRATGTTTRLQGGWFDTISNDDFGALFAEAFRVLRPDRHLYMFCDAETMFIAKPAGEAAGFRFWKPIVWDKVAIGMGYHYRARCEFILFFEKGKRRLNDLGVPDVLTAKRIRGGYPTEKPVALADILVRQSTAPGELVIDPFMGSGSTGVAALAAGRRFAGTDTSATALTLAHLRLGLPYRTTR